MTIHHYTKVETLLLILQRRTIRFSRADRLDDDLEVPYRTARLDPRRYFVSSWSNGLRGEAGLWHRYADLDRGVRLSLQDMPFDWTRLNAEFVRVVPDVLNGKEPRKCGIVVRDLEIPFDEATYFGSGYIISPMSTNLRETFGGAVHYVDDPIAEATKLVKHTDDGWTIHGDGTRVARIKDKSWADQDEYRFVLSATNGPSLDYASNPERYQEALKDQMESGAGKDGITFYPDVPYIDVPLGAKAFVDMTVTLGPRIPPNDRARVTHALRELAPSAMISESTIRLRS